MSSIGTSGTQAQRRVWSRVLLDLFALRILSCSCGQWDQRREGGRWERDLESEVGPSVFRIDILFVERQDFVVRDGSRVTEVDDASDLSLGHDQRDRDQLGEDGHGVWNVDNLQDLISEEGESGVGVRLTRSYLTILVTKLRGLRSSLIGMRTRRVRVLG
jgi:hypothetical protein